MNLTRSVHTFFIGFTSPLKRGKMTNRLRRYSELCTLVVLFFLALPGRAQVLPPDHEDVGQAAVKAGRLRGALDEYLVVLKESPEPQPLDNQRLRERIIKVVLRLDPPPPVPEEAEPSLVADKPPSKIPQLPLPLMPPSLSFTNLPIRHPPPPQPLSI